MKLKRLLMAIACAFFVSLAISTTALAKTGTYVYDEQDLLTDSEFQEIEQQAAQYAEKYGLGVYVLTTDTMGENADTGSGRREFAKGAYEQRDLGLTDDKNGFMLVIASTQRKYVTYGHIPDTSRNPFNEDSMDQISSDVKSHLSDNEWYEGIKVFYNDVGTYLDYFAENGEPWKEGDFLGFAFKVVITFFIPAAIAGIVVWNQKRAMHTAVMQTEAGRYLDGGSIALTAATDMFSHRTLDVVPIPKNDNDSDSDGGGFFDMGGGSFGSDGGDF